MTVQVRGKINRLLQKWPKGTVATNPWLEQNGVSRSLVQSYEAGGWVQRIGYGAVIRAGDDVRWQGGVFALQTQGSLSVHPASKTALGLHGSLHNLPLGPRPCVMLHGLPGEYLPAWFASRQWDADLELTRTRLFSADPHAGLVPRQFGEFSILVSSRERAMLELLAGLQPDSAHEEPWHIMEGLMTMRPSVLQELLQTCVSVKAKRLFMVLAEESSQPWLDRLDLSSVDFGSGKRAFSAGGYLHPRYGITVPRAWRGPQESH